MRYSIGAGNPEGMDFELSLDHVKEFTQEEFQAITENAFVYALEKEYVKTGHSWIGGMETDFLCEYLEQQGFTSNNPYRRYYLEPYWSGAGIKSEKLKSWINRKEIQDMPEYLKKREE